MAFVFANLTDEIRTLMIKEIDMDIAKGSLYLSPRFNNEGKRKYLELLKDAVKYGNEETFASALIKNNCFNEYEIRTTKKGTIRAKVPVNAATVLAEGEFNRYYMRALCLKVIEDNTGILVVYRAKEVSNPRQESEQKIGQTVVPNVLLDDLRNNIGIETHIGLPAGPNSGLSVKIG